MEVSFSPLCNSLSAQSQNEMVSNIMNVRGPGSFQLIARL